MRIAGRIIASILAFFATPLLIAAACNAAITSTLLAANTYRESLSNPTLAEDLLPIALPAVLAAIGDSELPPETTLVNAVELRAALGPENWRNLTDELISPQFLEERITQAIDVFEGITSEDYSVLDEVIDTSSIRNSLSDENIRRLAEEILQAVPTCDTQQEASIRAVSDGESMSLPVCAPADAQLLRISTDTIETWFQNLRVYLPDGNVTVGEFYNIPRSDAIQLNLILRTNADLTLLSYLIPLSLLSLIVVAVVRSQTSFGRWIGTIFSLAGGGVLLSIAVLQILAFGSLDLATQASDEFEQFVTQIFGSIIRELFTQSSSLLLVQAGIFIGIGFVLIAMTLIGNDNEPGSTDVLVMEDGRVISTASMTPVAIPQSTK